MDDKDFDAALISAAFGQAALTGWRDLSLVEAAKDADLPLDRVRARFPAPGTILMRFGSLADQAALAGPATEPLVRDRLFDLLMRRFDVVQQHRAGMLALLRVLPSMPILSLALSGATLRSMGWMLEAAGVSAQGLTGRLRVAGLTAVWLHALRAWKDDDSPDLSGTMAALDKALDQAERVSGFLGGQDAPPEATLDDPPVPGAPPESVPFVEETEQFLPPPPPYVDPPASPP
jgi:hypothetical protein